MVHPIADLEIKATTRQPSREGCRHSVFELRREFGFILEAGSDAMEALANADVPHNQEEPVADYESAFAFISFSVVGAHVVLRRWGLLANDRSAIGSVDFEVREQRQILQIPLEMLQIFDSLGLDVELGWTAERTQFDGFLVCGVFPLLDG